MDGSLGGSSGKSGRDDGFNGSGHLAIGEELDRVTRRGSDKDEKIEVDHNTVSKVSCSITHRSLSLLGTCAQPQSTQSHMQRDLLSMQSHDIHSDSSVLNSPLFPINGNCCMTDFNMLYIFLDFLPVLCSLIYTLPHKHRVQDNYFKIKNILLKDCQKVFC